MPTKWPCHAFHHYAVNGNARGSHGRFLAYKLLLNVSWDDGSRSWASPKPAPVEPAEDLSAFSPRALEAFNRWAFMGWPMAIHAANLELAGVRAGTPIDEIVKKVGAHFARPLARAIGRECRARSRA